MNLDTVAKIGEVCGGFAILTRREVATIQYRTGFTHPRFLLRLQYRLVIPHSRD